MSLVASMDGTQCEKSLMLYMEGIATIFIHVLDYYFVYGLFRLFAFFNCLVEIAMLFSTGCSRAGIPSPFLRGLLGELALHFSTLRLKAKLPPSTKM